MTNRRKHLRCTCCSGEAGLWQQWWNQDKGFGLCLSCAEWITSRGMTTEELTRTYGEPGVHRDVTAAERAEAQIAFNKYLLEGGEL